MAVSMAITIKPQKVVEDSPASNYHDNIGDDTIDTLDKGRSLASRGGAYGDESITVWRLGATNTD
jgi:hypothetical protein